MKKILTVIITTSMIFALININDISYKNNTSQVDNTKVDTSKLEHSYDEMMKGWQEFRHIGK